MQRPFFTPHLARPAYLTAPQVYRPTWLADPQALDWRKNALGLFRWQTLGWWDASDSSTLSTSSGPVVDQWRDKSDFGHHVSATGSARPTLDAAAVNGLDAVLFDDAAGEYLYGSTAAFQASIPDVYVWIVANCNDATISPFPFAVTDGETSTEDGMHCRWVGTVGGDPIWCQVFAAGASANAVTATGYTANTTHLVRCRFSSATSRGVTIDGGDEGTNTTERSVATLSYTAIGAYYKTAGAINPWSGHICEIVAARSPTAAQLTAVQSALAAKWGTP